MSKMRQWHHNCLLLFGKRDIEFVLGDTAYDREKVRQTAEYSGILWISPINRRNSKERKDAHGLVLPVFLKTRVGSMAVWALS